MDSINSYFLMIALPLGGFLFNALCFHKNARMGARTATLGMWLGCIANLISWIGGIPFIKNDDLWGVLPNELSWIMASLILYIGALVHQFSLRFIAGDRNYRRYFLLLTALNISMLLMVAADNLILFLMCWGVANAILVGLMIHKRTWDAAWHSGILALKTFGVGFLFLGIGCGMLSYVAGTLSLQEIGRLQGSDPIVVAGLGLILLAAFTQSGVWPFHRWLLSSLNTPTTVSSIMHAVSVIGGVGMLVRIAPLYKQTGHLLELLFLFGVVTLILGTLWHLFQPNLKGMLSCSTMAHMGYAFMQCGLGLFPVAVAHLCWHGLYKAFYFLRSGSNLNEFQNCYQEKGVSIAVWIVAVTTGFIGALGFAFSCGISFYIMDTNLILVAFAWMAGTQCSLALMREQAGIPRFLLASAMCFFSGVIYGTSVYLIEWALSSLHISYPRTLTPIHLIPTGLIVLIWLGLNFKSLIIREDSLWWRRFYVTLLNSSQPHPKTITSCRQKYQF